MAGGPGRAAFRNGPLKAVDLVDLGGVWEGAASPGPGSATVIGAIGAVGAWLVVATGGR